MRSRYSTLALLIALPALAGAPTGSVEQSGRHFTETVQIPDGEFLHTLTLTGTATRKKVVVKVYAMAHYMDMSSATFDGHEAALAAALSGALPMQIVMEFMRDVDAEKIQNAYREGLRNQATDSEWEQMQAAADAFVALYADGATDGQRYVLTSYPDGRVVPEVNGQTKPTIKDPVFARVLWRVWLAEGSPVNPKDLVKLIEAKD